MEGNAEQTNQIAADPIPVAPTPAETPSEPNPAFDIGAFDGRECLANLHREITDFLHYQWHVRLYAASSLLLLVPRPDDNVKLGIISLLQEENQRLKNLHKLLNAVETNNKEIIEIYKSTRTDYDWHHH
jgi:hypothetical protein